MVTIILDTEEHPGGKQYGWVVSGYADYTDLDGNESNVGPAKRDYVEGVVSDLPSEADNKTDAKRLMKELAEELITDMHIDAVSAHVEGNSWMYFEKKKPKARKPRAKKAHPGQGTLFGMRRR